MGSRSLKLFQLSLCITILLAASKDAFAQGAASDLGSAGAPVGPPGVVLGPGTFDARLYGTVNVYLRDEDGKAITSQRAIVRIFASPITTQPPLPNSPNMTGQMWIFSGVSIGRDYDVEVSLPGYYGAREHVHLPDKFDSTADVIVLMRPIDQELVYHPPNSDFPLPPGAQKEIQRSLDDLQRGQVQSSIKHTQKALQIAPDNPYVQYVMGLTYVLRNQFKEAKPLLERSVSIDWKEPLALSALGTARYRLGDDTGAVEVLNKAVQLDPTMWKAEWTLAVAYLSQRKYADARDHAEQAMKIGKDKAEQVELVLGQALAGLGEREQAAKLFDKFAGEFPSDANAATALKWAALMRQPAVTVSVPTMGAVVPTALGIPPVPPIEIPPRPDWAPPDVDVAKPFVISGATCPLEQVLQAAGQHAQQFVSTLEEFSATEEFQAIEMKRDGSLDKPNAQAYNYFVLVQHVNPTVFQVDEVREQRSQAVNLSARLSDLGVPGLALAFHPTLQDNLKWECEGLGKWNDQPAWVVHFRQRPDRPSVLYLFATPSHSYSMGLKGRAWVSEDGGQVLHLDTDLVKEIQPVDLRREHFSIDYKPVAFQKHNVTLWVPENVDTYIQYQGHFLHHYHHFTNFKLFWVGATQKISEPKEAVQPQNQTQQNQQPQ